MSISKNERCIKHYYSRSLQKKALKIRRIIFRLTKYENIIKFIYYLFINDKPVDWFKINKWNRNNLINFFKIKFTVCNILNSILTWLSCEHHVVFIIRFKWWLIILRKIMKVFFKHSNTFMSKHTCMKVNPRTFAASTVVYFNNFIIIY